MSVITRVQQPQHFTLYFLINCRWLSEGLPAAFNKALTHGWVLSCVTYCHSFVCKVKIKSMGYGVRLPWAKFLLFKPECPHLYNNDNNRTCLWVLWGIHELTPVKHSVVPGVIGIQMLIPVVIMITGISCLQNFLIGSFLRRKISLFISMVSNTGLSI